MTRSPTAILPDDYSRARSPILRALADLRATQEVWDDCRPRTADECLPLDSPEYAASETVRLRLHQQDWEVHEVLELPERPTHVKHAPCTRPAFVILMTQAVLPRALATYRDTEPNLTSCKPSHYVTWVAGCLRLARSWAALFVDQHMEQCRQLDAVMSRMYLNTATGEDLDRLSGLLTPNQTLDRALAYRDAVTLLSDQAAIDRIYLAAGVVTPEEIAQSRWAGMDYPLPDPYPV